MNIYKYTDNSQAIWVYPLTYSQLCEKYGKTSDHPYYKTPKLPVDKKAKLGYYTYPCIFECEAETIAEADKLFEEALNSGKVQLKSEKKKPKTYDVTKMPNIGVTFEKLTFWKRMKKFLTDVFYCGIMFISWRENV